MIAARRVAAAMVLAASALASAEPRRLAVVVGSNGAAEGRPALRYAHDDARAMAAVLADTGRFAGSDITLLLEPSPSAVLAALDAALDVAAAAHGDAVVVFYYSGHADENALLPSGQALPFAELKRRLSSDRAEVRLGIIDACRGGGWTQAKGFRPAKAFEVGLPKLETEGSALMASSSGTEDAAEAELLHGSFFTHHLVAALRGAADESHDGRVTVSEAFAYANKMTVRDSARVSGQPQHPSFDLKLRGRQDLVLASLDSARAPLTVTQRHGSLQLVDLASGQIVLESPTGADRFVFALPAGDYLVRRIDDGRVLSKQVRIDAATPAAIDEAELADSGEASVGLKGSEPVTPEFVPRHLVMLSTGIFDPTEGAPGDPYGAFVQLEYVWRLNPWIGWRALRAQYDVHIQPYIPVAHSPVFQLGSDLIFVPWQFDKSHGTLHFETYLGVGPMVMGFVSTQLFGTFGGQGETGISLTIRDSAVIRLSISGAVFWIPPGEGDFIGPATRAMVSTNLGFGWLL